MGIDAKRAIARENHLTQTLRNYPKRAGVYFGEPEVEPLGQVEAIAVGPINYNGEKPFRGVTRIVSTDHGLVMISGNYGDSISVKSAAELLVRGDKARLTRALRSDEERKRKKIIYEQQPGS